MRVRYLGSVNLVLGDFFYSCICSCVMCLRLFLFLGSSEALMFGDKPFMYYIQKRWEWSLWLKVETCAKKGFSFNSMLHMKTEFL
jgi:hypothetical protein